MIVYSDAHVHPEGLDSEELKSAKLMMVCSSQFSDWEKLSVLESDRLVKSYGIHPWYADQWNDCSRSDLISYLDNDSGAGVGEIGLDRVRGDYDLQIAVFRDQIEIASKFNRIVSIHMVKSEEDVLKILKSYKGLKKVILHGFTGSAEYAKVFSNLGYYISISSRLLSKPKEKVRGVLNNIDLKHLLIETDAPYFGKGFTGMEKLLSDVSEIMGTSKDDLLKITNENAERAFK